MGLARTPPPQRGHQAGGSTSQPTPSRPIAAIPTEPAPVSAPEPAPTLSPVPEPEEAVPVAVDTAAGDVSTAAPSDADKTTLSTLTPERAFVPRHPGVMRTPPGGHQPIAGPSSVSRAGHIDERPIRPAPVVPDAEAVEQQHDQSTDMEVDEPSVAGPAPASVSAEQPSASQSAESIAEAEAEAAVEADLLSAEPSIQEDVNMEAGDIEAPAPTPAPPSQAVAVERPTTPAPVRATTPTASAAAPTPGSTRAPRTPAPQSTAPKTPRSRSRRPTEPLASPPRLLSADQPDFGRRYQLTMETLERAVRAGAQRWTADHLKGCFPVLSKDLSKAMENTCLAASKSMSDNILSNARGHMEHYKLGAALQSIDAVDAEAREYARDHPVVEGSQRVPRPDAWRPDLPPQALVAATLLPIYDDAYAKLREEYLDLHKYSSDKLKSIREKQAALREIESGVADGVVDLQKTIEIMDRMPSNDMIIWTELAETKMDSRAPERPV
ncbi:hypothetical protein IAU60_003866 [Kwoniella sp. DSM 27419]